jgi:hypothetical protein
MPHYEQNRGRWAGNRGDWDTDRGRDQWRGPRGGPFWRDSGAEYSSSSTGDEDWREGSRGYPGGYGGGEWTSGPGDEGDFGRSRMGGYGSNWGRGRPSGYYGTDALRDGYGRFSYGGPGARYGSQSGYFDRGFGTEPYSDQFSRGVRGRYAAEDWHRPYYGHRGYGPYGGYSWGTGYDADDWNGPYGGRGWTGERNYAGRGPRGYQRSDERIKEDVCEVLTAHGGVDASHIDVRVENGEVTLTGHVDDRNQKRMAEDAVDDVFSVRDVHNQLRVEQEHQQTEAGRQREPATTGAPANSRSR